MILLSILVDLQHNQIMRLYARALNAKHKPKYSLGIICQWIGGLVNSPLLARSAYGSFAVCSKDESDTASRTKSFIGNSWRYFSELCSVLDTTSIGATHRIGVETSYILPKQVHTYYLNKFTMTILISYSYFFLSFDIYYTALICRIGKTHNNTTRA